MAVVVSKIEAMQDGDTTVADIDIVVDTDTALLLERKTVIAGVQTDSGETVVVAGQKTTLAAVQVMLRYSYIIFFAPL